MTYDPATGTFGPTGSMIGARGEFTATLLTDGTVLVAGGTKRSESWEPTAVFASAEVHDPGTGAFSPTGSMATARYRHTATLLADGRVLMAGGTLNENDDPLASAEIYDPMRRTFSPAGSMATGRLDHTATSLKAASSPSRAGSAPTTRCLPGDPYRRSPRPSYSIQETGTFGPTASLSVARIRHSAIPLHDGRVLIMGGAVDSGVAAGLVETYDPATGTFARGPRVPDTSTSPDTVASVGTPGRQASDYRGMVLAVFLASLVLLLFRERWLRPA